MPENSMLSASDVAMLQGRDDWGSNSFMWIFALLILANGGFGGWGNNNRFGYEPQYATQQDVQSTAQYGNLLDGNRDILSAVHDGTARAIQATDQAKYESINVAKDLQSVLLNQIGDVKVAQAAALANQNECCLNTRLDIADKSAGLGSQVAQSRYDAAMNTAMINSNIVDKIQEVKDMISQNKAEEQAAYINRLELQNAMSNVVRYPNMWTFNAGSFPSCFNCSCATR